MSARDTNLVADYRNYSHLSENFPKVTKPRVVNSFSIDRKGVYHESLEQLKYLNLPVGRVQWDLNNGYEIYEKKDSNCNNITYILQFIEKNWKRMHIHSNHPDRDKKIIFPDIVCFRGLLRLLMCTPYEASPRCDGWIILASKYRGTIYLYEKYTPEKEVKVANMPKDHQKFCYYGYKFEQYIMTKEPGKPNDVSEPVIEREEFDVGFKTEIGHHRVFYIAEVDGIDSKVPVDKDADLSRTPVEFVEVKTTKKIEKFYDEKNFHRYKLRTWWCQSFLAGIETVYYGERTAKGIVETVKEIPVKDMPKLGKNDWSTVICMKFCILFLDMVKDFMKNIDDSDTVIKFSFNPRVSDYVQFEEFLGKSPLTFLEPSFVEFLCAQDKR
ncbi:decapping and exoribonuclease protein-like [Phlebotomus argentipes]|uniref:decapping and exoribonuclease protein-like n=1 Tax=Phlebotomus argentipes TaxID=94469 RepID=UPI002892C71C|nr:decapping and exoribonuclease protein-like [Phlebotomus argentipes]